MSYTFSVIIPAYNEEKNIERGVLQEVDVYLRKQPYRWEVVIVDDGSNDKTAEFISHFLKEHSGFSLLREPHRGKAAAILAGFKKAKGDILLFTDFDQSVPLSEIEQFFPKFEEGYDIVIGSRMSRQGAPLLRRVTGYGFIVLRKLLLGLPYKDTQCGFKAFTRDSAGKIIKRMVFFSRDAKQKGYAPTAGFDLEILLIAQRLGLRVAEAPVIWTHKNKSHFNTLKVSFLALKDIILIRRLSRSSLIF